MYYSFCKLKCNVRSWIQGPHVREVGEKQMMLLRAVSGILHVVESVSDMETVDHDVWTFGLPGPH